MSAERLIEDSLNDILEAARKAIGFVDEIGSAKLADDETRHEIFLQQQFAQRIAFGDEFAKPHARSSRLNVGRNALCLCGSGKKFKNCCGRP